MKKVKNGLVKTVDFVYKHKLISFFVAISIATSLILFNVLANEDEFANKLKVTNAMITAIQDGTEGLDPADGPGKDSSLTNGILRNHDNIKYRVSYKLELKEADPEVSQVEGRNIVVDVVLPKNIGAVLTTNNLTADGGYVASALTSDYNFYEFIMNNISTTSSEPNTFDIFLEYVNSKIGDTTFSPIILIKEQTDSNYKAITEMNDSEKEALVNNIPANKVSCDSNTINCTTAITGVYDFDVELLQGVYSNPDASLTNKKYPVGFRVYANSEFGKYTPSEVSFDVTYSTEDTGITLSYVDNSFVNYKDNSKDYIVYLPHGAGELNNINNTVSYTSSNNGGTATVGNLSSSLGTIGTAAFEINSVRNSSTSQESGIKVKLTNLKVGNDVIKAEGSEITITDYAYKFVSTYDSTINISENQSTDYEIPGNAFLNYNQQFQIHADLAYGIVGNSLDELHNYIKVDPDAFTIIKEGNSVSDSTAIIRYGRGLWNSTYFESTGACNININSLNKEQLMNLYGGPCIRAKNTVIWDDSNIELPIIIIDTVFGAAGDDTLNVNPGMTASITINGKVKNSTQLNGTSHQIVTSAVGTFVDEGTPTTYYMSNVANYNDKVNASDVNNYKKSVYNFGNRNITSNHDNKCHLDNCSITGTTVHIGSFKVSGPDIHSYINDVERTSFYDYPIEWRINAGATSDDDSIEYTGASIIVTIPRTLNYLYAETMVNNNRVAKEWSTKNEGLNEIAYIFNFTQDEIENGAINTLSVFTDIYLDTPSNTYTYVTAEADITGRRLDGATYTTLRDIRPYYYRDNYVDVTLYNESSITTYGDAAPRYIEKGQSYTYTMKSYNNSAAQNGTGYSYTGATMYFMLPYIEDSNYKIYDKKFTNNSFKIKLTETPAGYSVYYTTDAAKNVVSDIHNITNPDSTTVWKVWSNPTTDITATAIKIVKNSNWDIRSYFYSENGISAVVTPINNAQADAYYNGYTLTVDRPGNYIDVCDDANPEDCGTGGPKLFFQSSSSLVEVYSRQISGFVFEDYNYSNMYENGEDQLKDIVVELYKLNNSEYNETSDPENPNLYVNPERDELISTKSTSSTGAYSFTGLAPGNYYVLYRYDGNKYTPSDRYGGLLTGVSNANQINSKAVARNNVPNEAVSRILVLSNSSSANERYINLGLRIRKEFGVEINKYITRIIQTSNQGTKTYEYDKATKVNIDIKNLRNTKFRVTYSFDIVNTKYFPGYIGVIADLMPAGMTFDNTLEGNEDWILSDGILYYTGLENRILLPGEKHYFSLTLDLETNKGGTYTNIVAADMPILMGDEIPVFDYSDITINDNSGNAAGSTDDNSGNAAGGTDDNGGNAAGGTDDNQGGEGTGD